MCGGRDCTTPDDESQTCYGEDPSDCIMSEWGDWSPCSQETCDISGSQSRSRNVTTLAGCGGQNCTEELTNKATCTQPECCKSTLFYL